MRSNSARLFRRSTLRGSIAAPVRRTLSTKSTLPSLLKSAAENGRLNQAGLNAENFPRAGKRCHLAATIWVEAKIAAMDAEIAAMSAMDDAEITAKIAAYDPEIAALVAEIAEKDDTEIESFMASLLAMNDAEIAAKAAAIAEIAGMNDVEIAGLLATINLEWVEVVKFKETKGIKFNDADISATFAKVAEIMTKFAEIAEITGMNEAEIAAKAAEITGIKVAEITGMNEAEIAAKAAEIEEKVAGMNGAEISAKVAGMKVAEIMTKVAEIAEITGMNEAEIAAMAAEITWNTMSSMDLMTNDAVIKGGRVAGIFNFFANLAEIMPKIAKITGSRRG